MIAAGLQLETFAEGLFESHLSQMKEQGQHICVAKVEPGRGVYIPAGWVAILRVLSGSGDHNSVHGLRVAMHLQDPAVLATLRSMKDLLDAGVSPKLPGRPEDEGGPSACGLEFARALMLLQHRG